VIGIDLPPPEGAHVAALAGRLQELLGPDLLGLYLFGSAAYGGYRPGRSDLDVQGVVRRALPDDRKRVLAGRLLHASLPCPGKGLELVLYRAEVAARRSPTAPAVEQAAAAAYLAEVEQELHYAVVAADWGPVSGRHGVNAI